jgi:tetratricopeptide (TPR) repeat protein
MVALIALTLAVTCQQNPTSPKGTFDDSKSSASQPFQSVGVRGTIDAGGYGASATEKTQTEFYELLTDLQVAVLRNIWAPADPCAGAASLRRPAIALMIRGEFSPAVIALEKLARAQAEPATRQLLGLAYEAIGQLAAATEQYRISSLAAPGDSAASAAYSIALLLNGDLDRTEEIAHRASEENGDPSGLGRLCLGATLFQKGRVKEALRLFLDAAQLPASKCAASGFIALAVRSADAVALTHTIDVLNSLTRESPCKGNIHYAMACALAAAAGGVPNTAQAAAVEAQLKSAITLAPQLADAHFRLGSIYAEREDLPQAIAEYQAALADNPRLIEAHYRLGQLYNRARQPRRAKEELELHRQLRTRQKREIESAMVPVHLAAVPPDSCP